MHRRNIDRYSADSLSHYRPTIHRLSTDYPPTIDQPSTNHRPTIDRLSTDYRPTIDRLSTDYRPTIDRLSTDCRPLYRPLCRPISQSTLPTVNKIQKPAKEGLSRYRLCTRILTTLLKFVLLLQLNESGKAHLFIRPSLAFFIF